MRALRPWLLFAATLGLGVAILGSPSPTHGEEPAPVRAALGLEGGVGAEPGAASGPVVTPGGIPVLEQAWFTPAYGLPERAKQVRGAADRIGVESMDAAARAVILGKLGDDRREEAEAAVLLAPDLPIAHAALARARWAEQDTVGAAAATLAALGRSFVHLEAALWTTATAGWFLFVALLTGGFGYIALRGAAALPLAARDLGGFLESSMSTPARLALVVSLVLIPPALGEGPVGALAVLFLLALLYGEAQDRRALVAAALFAFTALHPLSQGVGRALVAFGSDPIAEAAWSSERGFLDPVESERLAVRGARDSLALHAIARRSRRAGELDAAEARFMALIEAEPKNAVLLNDLGNLRYHQGQLDEATDLYQDATGQLNSAVIWFNLAQAHGRNIEITQHENALTVAQEIDRAMVGTLASRIGNAEQGFVADLPLPIAQIRRRMLEHSGSAFADQNRRAWAPGWIGLYPGVGALLFLVLVFVAATWRKRSTRSLWCSQCVAISEGLAGVDSARHALCDACRKSQGQRSQVRLALDDESAPGWSRHLRVGMRVMGFFFPGLGLTVPRPLAAWAGLTGGVLVGAVWLHGSGRIPDPLAMGAAAQWIVLLLAALGACTYLLAGWFHVRAESH